MSTKLKGISFPFRLERGGVVMSETDMSSAKHSIEALQQVLMTRRNERAMECHIYSDIDVAMFKNPDENIETLLRYEIEVASQMVDNIKITNIDFIKADNVVLASVTFTLLPFNTEHTDILKVGEF